MTCRSVPEHQDDDMKVRDSAKTFSGDLDEETEPSYSTYLEPILLFSFCGFAYDQPTDCRVGSIFRLTDSHWDLFLQSLPEKEYCQNEVRC